MTSDTNNLWPITGPHFQIGSLFKARHASTKSWSQVEKKREATTKKNSSRPIRTKLDGNVLRGGRKEGLEGLKAGGGVK